MSKFIALRIAILNVLERIASKGPKDNTLGICTNVCELMPTDRYSDEDIDCLLSYLFSSWPDKSTCSAYPVGNWTKAPSKVFWYYHDNRRDMWNKETRYGTARWALLMHCHNKLTELIKEG